MLSFVIKGVYKRIFICIKMHVQRRASEWYPRSELIWQPAGRGWCWDTGMGGRLFIACSFVT